MALLTGSNKIKTAVFISGTGSNLKSLIKFSKLKKSPISINLIVSNDSKSKGLQYGKIFKIKKKIFDFKKEHVSSLRPVQNSHYNQLIAMVWMLLFSSQIF